MYQLFFENNNIRSLIVFLLYVYDVLGYETIVNSYIVHYCNSPLLSSRLFGEEYIRIMYNE